MVYGIYLVSVGMAPVQCTGSKRYGLALVVSVSCGVEPAVVLLSHGV